MSGEDPSADRDVLEDVQRLITSLQAHPDPKVGDQVSALLQIIDTVHRIGLTRLVSSINSMAGDSFLYRLCGDPAVRLLLMSYGLIAIDRRIQAEEALDSVRGHLHARGVDVELREVVGGVVYVRLHGLAASGLAEEPVRHDIEAALREGLIGLQELVIGDRSSGAASAGVASAIIPVASLKRLQRPTYRQVLAADALAAGQTVAVEVDSQSLLLARVDGDVYAVRNRCGDSPLPLQFGQLEGGEIVCSWHACRWDVRTGRRTDGLDGHLTVFPVRIADGQIEVALGVQPATAS